MDPIKINVEVNLGEATIDALRQIFSAPLFATPAQPAAPSKPEAPAKPIPHPKPEKSKTIGADPIGTGAEDVDDLPPDDAPDPAPKPERKPKTPTEADARAAVKAARDRGVSPKAIKDYMKNTFGIAASVECPEGRRAELIEGLKKLAA